MTPAEQIKISKFLSLVLRHDPGAAFVHPDVNGWVPVDALLVGMRRAGFSVSRAALEQIVAESPKKRFTFGDNGQRIRAAQGHSIEVDLGLAPSTPPNPLFHGTAAATMPQILAEGLRPMARQQIHLSNDAETARTVGARHGKPAILEVDTAGAQRAGIRFFLADNGVWLADAIPAGFLTPREETRG